MQVQFVTSVSALAAFLRSRIRGEKGWDGSYGRFRQICEGTENIEEHLFHVRTAGLLAVALVAAGWEGLGVQVVHAESRVVVVVFVVGGGEGGIGGGGAFHIIYDRFLLPSRFLKLDGRIFISANSIECSWPFQWNQFTPWRGGRQDVQVKNRVKQKGSFYQTHIMHTTNEKLVIYNCSF